MARVSRYNLPHICEPPPPLLRLLPYSYRLWSLHGVRYGGTIEDIIFEVAKTRSITNRDEEDYMQAIMQLIPEHIIEDHQFLPTEVSLVDFKIYCLARRADWVIQGADGSKFGGGSTLSKT